MNHQNYLTKQISLASLSVLILFPLVILLDGLSKPLYIPFIEELLGRFIPLVITYILLPQGTLGDRVAVGIANGMTFGILEIIVKTTVLGSFSPLMTIPYSFVHCINGIISSIIIGESIENKWYYLIPLAYIICVFWHELYNVGLVGFY